MSYNIFAQLRIHLIFYYYSIFFWIQFFFLNKTEIKINTPKRIACIFEILLKNNAPICLFVFVRLKFIFLSPF